MIETDNSKPSESIATNLLDDLSNKMSNIIIDSESDTDNITGTSQETTLPRFDLPWNNPTTDVAASLYLTNARNPLTYCTPATVARSTLPSGLVKKPCTGE